MMDAADYWDMIGTFRRALGLPCDRWEGCERGYAHDGACRRRRTADGAIRAVETAAYTAPCEHCGEPLRHRGIAVAGGHAVTLTTCPRCDRYDERMDD